MAGLPDDDDTTSTLVFPTETFPFSFLDLDPGSESLVCDDFGEVDFSNPVQGPQGPLDAGTGLDPFSLLQGTIEDQQFELSSNELSLYCPQATDILQVQPGEIPTLSSAAHTVLDVEQTCLPRDSSSLDYSVSTQLGNASLDSIEQFVDSQLGGSFESHFFAHQGNFVSSIESENYSFIPSQPLEPHSSTQLSRTGTSAVDSQPARPIFGPSKPVELPRKRKRTRRPMTEEEKKRKKDADRQVCWRCKKDGQKCVGGPPCLRCLKIVGKARILRNPCVKAYFSDFVLQGSYFTFPTLYQALVIQTQSTREIARQVLISALILAKDKALTADKFFLTKSSFGIAPNCAIFWGSAFIGCLEALGYDLLSLDNDGLKLAPEISKAIRQPQSQLLNSAFPNYFFELPERKTSLESWLVKRVLFCELGRVINRAMSKSTFDVPAEFEIEELRQVAMLNIWLTMRQCETRIFQRLEKFVNGDISDYKTSDIEGAIRAMTYIILTSSTLCADHLALNETLEIEDKIVNQFKDRHERLRTAIFVYICILNSKRPSNSNFWDLFGNIGCIDQIKVEFGNCLDNMDRLSAGFKSWESIVRASGREFYTYSKILGELDPDKNPLTFEDEELDKFEDDQEFFDDEWRHSIADGSASKGVHFFDFCTTGGLLDAISTGNTGDLSIMIFDPLPFINWKNAFSPVRVQGTQEINEDSIQRIFASAKITRRLDLIRVARSVQEEMAQTGLDLYEFLQRTYSLGIENITSGLSDVSGFSSEKFEVLMSQLREGYRWSDLIDTVKSEEIMLVPNGNNDGHDSGSTPLQRCAISQIVSDGTDDDFQRLKKNLKSTFYCVETTCAKLKGFVALFTRAETLMAHGDLKGAQDIGHQLQDLATACFGDCDQAQARFDSYFGKYEEALGISLKTSPSDKETGLYDEEILQLESELEIWYRQNEKHSRITTDVSKRTGNIY